MEDLSADDDILSDILLDTLEFEPPISTHKMNPAYRPARFSTSDVISIVRRHVVVEADVSKAAEEISKLGIIRKHLQGKSAKQTSGFLQHAKRYLETYLADSGVEFALTDRYLTVPERGKKTPNSTSENQSSTAGSSTSKTATITHPHPQQRGGDRTSSKTGGAAPPGSKADLRVLAMKNFATGDLIINCKGGVRDLTKAEDEALREEAALSREARKENKYKGVLGQGRDFSVVRSSRKGCSQLFLGPARFVNHDCNPNTEFHRLGSQMVFRAIRPISIGSEITTFYGENYFEWGNSECLCQTCEDRGTGAWGRLEDFPLPPDVLAAAARANASNGTSSTSTPIPTSISTSTDNLPQDQSENTSSEESKGAVRRRSSARRSITNSNKASPHQSHDSPTASTSKINGDPSSSSAIPSSSTSDQLPKIPGGPNCKCVTCGALFDPPEAWWTPDECGRCERHYKIFKADWPSREPTERVDSTPRGKGPLVAGIKGASAKFMKGKGKGKGKGKAKAEDSDLDSDSDVRVNKSQGKAKGRTSSSGKMNGSFKARKSLGNQDSASTTSNGVSSTDEFSESSTPIKLSPLRDLQGPSSYSEPRPKVKRPRKSGSSLGRKDADDETTPRNSNKASSSQNALEDSGSELTEDESDPGSVVGMGGPRISKRKEKETHSSPNAEDDDATTVSSSDSSLAGPKMLGKEATTGTLALFWGAPEGDTRARRQSSKAAVPVSQQQPAPGSLKPESKKKSFSRQRSGSGNHDDLRRSASAASGISSSRPNEAKNGGRKDHTHVKDEPMDLSELKSTNSSSKTKSVGRKSQDNDTKPVNSHSAGTNGSSSKRGEVKMEEPTTSTHNSRENSISSSSSSSSHAIPGLATQGTARTSLSNLALAWSAGSDSSRTRKQASREPLTVSSTTSSEERDVNSHPAKRARRSAGAVLTGSSRSETPEFNPKLSSSSSVSTSNSQSSSQNPLKRPRGRPPQKAKNSIAADGDGMKNGIGHQSRHSTGSQLEDLSGSSQRPRSPLAGPSRGVGSNVPAASATAGNDRDFKKPRLEMNPGPSFGWPVSVGSQNINTNAGQLQSAITLTSQSHLPRQSTSSNSQTSVSSAAVTASPPASTSPLVGPRPSTGGPIRKNLRWGRGKVSESRPTGGSKDGNDEGSSPKKASSPIKQARPLEASHSRSNSSSSLSGQVFAGQEPLNSVSNGNGKHPSSTLAHPDSMSTFATQTNLSTQSTSSNILSDKKVTQAHQAPSPLSTSTTTAPSTSAPLGHSESGLSLAPPAPTNSLFTSLNPPISTSTSFIPSQDSKITSSQATPLSLNLEQVGDVEGQTNGKGTEGTAVEQQINNTDVAPSQIFQSQTQRG